MHIVLGAMMLVTCWGLFAKQGWARWTAIVLATLSTLVQMAAFSSFPLWAIVVVTLDVIVIYQLTARWAY